MTNDERVLSLLISLYKEVIDTKAKLAVSHGLEPILAEQVEFSHQYRASVKAEVERAADSLKALGFPANEVDARLTTLFTDIIHPHIQS
jgi:hypothetical protein